MPKLNQVEEQNVLVGESLRFTNTIGQELLERFDAVDQMLDIEARMSRGEYDDLREVDAELVHCIDIAMAQESDWLD
jgi:hypothetical protein